MLHLSNIQNRQCRRPLNYLYFITTVDVELKSKLEIFYYRFIYLTVTHTQSVFYYIQKRARLFYVIKSNKKKLFLFYGHQ